jgi:hypothetical protein
LPFTALDFGARIGHKALRAFAERAALLRDAHGARPAWVRLAGVGHNAARLWRGVGHQALRALALGRPLLATQVFPFLLPYAFYEDKMVVTVNKKLYVPIFSHFPNIKTIIIQKITRNLDFLLLSSYMYQREVVKQDHYKKHFSNYTNTIL